MNRQKHVKNLKITFTKSIIVSLIQKPCKIVTFSNAKDEDSLW